jgi:Icc-related predicted phosphoesterase
LRLLVLTDIHDRKGYFKYLYEKIDTDIDYIVIAGDLTYFKKRSTAIGIMERLYELFNKKILFVPGNCDDPELLDLDSIDDKIINIHGRLVKIDKYVFYGVGGSNITPFSTWIEWSEEEIKSMIRKLGGMTNDLIMVTHVPIYGVMDEIGGVHVGSRVLREFLEEKQPIIWITGHLHEYSGYVRVGRTIVLNPGPFMRGYYALIELSDNNVNVKIKNVFEEKPG